MSSQSWALRGGFRSGSGLGPQKWFPLVHSAGHDSRGSAWPTASTCPGLTNRLKAWKSGDAPKKEVGRIPPPYTRVPCALHWYLYTNDWPAPPQHPLALPTPCRVVTCKLPEDSVLAVQMGALVEGEEELRLVGVWAGVCHAEHARLGCG